MLIPDKVFRTSLWPWWSDLELLKQSGSRTLKTKDVVDSFKKSLMKPIQRISSCRGWRNVYYSYIVFRVADVATRAIEIKTKPQPAIVYHAWSSVAKRYSLYFSAELELRRHHQRLSSHRKAQNNNRKSRKIFFTTSRGSRLKLFILCEIAKCK